MEYVSSPPPWSDVLGCTVHRPGCMIDVVQRKRVYVLLQEPCLYSNHIIIPVPGAALLQGHYRTHCGAFVEQSTLEQIFLVKFAFKGQSSSSVQYSSPVFQSSSPV